MLLRIIFLLLLCLPVAYLQYLLFLNAAQDLKKQKVGPRKTSARAFARRAARRRDITASEQEYYSDRLKRIAR